jgi:hypothetical protein
LGRDTVGIWRNRFARQRLEGLFDEPRVGRPREIGDDEVEAVVVATLETKPEGATHWSTRSLAQKMGLSQTPTHASWLNQVERWFAGLTDRQLRRGSHRSRHELRSAIEAYIAAINNAPKPFVWVKSADQILRSIARFAQRTLDFHRDDA